MSMYKCSERSKKMLFSLVCIPLRAFFIVVVYLIETRGIEPVRQSMASFLLLFSLGFILSAIKRTEYGFFGSKVYWYISIHSLLFLIASIMMFFDLKFAFVALSVDLFIGILVVLDHYLLVI